MAAETPIYVINRAVDQDRLDGFAASAAALGLTFERIEALDGHDPDAPLFLYRMLLRDAFWGEDSVKPGALACAVSHMTAWTRMLADGAGAALICEDDARLTADPMGLAATARRYDGVDVVLANDRMAAWRAAAPAKSDPAQLSAAKLLPRMAKAGLAPDEGGLSRGPGADAYLVTRAGAQKLLTMLRDVGLIGGVDWLILAAGAGQGVGWPETDTLDPAFEGRDPLNVLIAAEPVATRADLPSAIRHRDAVPLAALRDGPSLGGEGQAQTPANLRPDPVADAFGGGRFYEEPALAMMARWMPRGGVFADVGAHVGNHTLFMLRHGGAGRAIPFEHNRFAIEALRRVMEANGLTDRIDDEALGYGLAEEAGKRQARGGKRNPFVNRLKEGFDEPVKVRPGDALLREKDVDMIKIDVGGEEREVLKGLKKTLKRKRPLLVVEMTRPRSQKAAALIERLHYREAERAEWDEGGETKRIVLYRPAPT